MTFYYVYKSISEILNRYNIAIIEYFLVLMVIFMFLSAVKARKWNIYKPDLLCVTLVFLSVGFLYSFHNLPNYAALKDCVVFIGGILVCGIFSLRMTEKRFHSFLSATWITMFCVFIINILFILMGPGRIVWGHSVTLSGMYYYKTDYATFLMQFLIITQYKLSQSIKKKRKREKHFCIGLIGLTSLLTVISGSRIFVVMLAVYYVLLYFKLSGKTIKKAIKLRTVFFLGTAGVITLGTLNFTAKLLPGWDMLTFDFTDIFSRGNTQGRDAIWSGIADFMMNRATLTQKLFGVDLVSSGQTNARGSRAHSMYIYVWYSMGIAGVIVLLIFLFCILKICINSRNREISYLLTLALAQTMISGVTQEIIVYTQQTWFMFMILGMALAEQKDRGFYDYDKQGAVIGI